MVKILFVCHGSILKNPGKACRINGFTKRKGAYYTTTTPFFERALNDISEVTCFCQNNGHCPKDSTIILKLLI